jgi:citrate lyase subunit beta/citryl-CoA lyase
MRSALFVPGDDEKKLAKALLSGADALLLDLEDSVAYSAKERARRIVAEFIRTVATQTARPRLLVRVNPLESGLAEADLDAIMPSAPEGVMLPKSLGGASVQELGVKLAVREASFGLEDGVTRIVPIATESARALFGMDSYRGCSQRLAGIAWGGEDLSADLGAESNRQSDGAYAGPYFLARNLTLLGATAAHVAPIDTVFTNFRDEEGLRAEAIAARRDGFWAKMAIHPAQVRVINQVFTLAPNDIARARAIIAAFEAAPGAGVVGLDGEMLDRPHQLRAEKILARAAAQIA